MGLINLAIPLSFIEIIRADARLRPSEDSETPIEMRRILAITLRKAVENLSARLEEVDDWTELFAWAGQGARATGVSACSQAAASFVAALEMDRRGDVEIRQGGEFGEIGVVGR